MIWALFLPLRTTNLSVLATRTGILAASALVGNSPDSAGRPSNECSEKRRQGNTNEPDQYAAAVATLLKNGLPN